MSSDQKLQQQISLGSTGGGSVRERAFAQRLQRNQHPSQSSSGTQSLDRRSQVSRLSISDTHPGLPYHQGVTFFDIVEPNEKFEEFILSQQPLGDESDPTVVLSEFPDDDIEVTNIPQTYRTIGPPVPENAHLTTDPQVKDCIKAYTEDWSIVNRKYQLKGFGSKSKQRGTRRTESFIQHLQKHEYEIENRCRSDTNSDETKAPPQSKDDKDIPRKSWAASIFDLQSCTPDPLLQGLLDDTPIEELDGQNEIFRHKNRVSSFFSIYGPNIMEEHFITRIPAIIPCEHIGQKVLVRCTELKLEFDIEPIFATMALYDCKHKKKISENFHFDMNAEWHKKMIANHTTSNPDISTLAKSGIFSVTNTSNDVCLVVKLEKVLQQGDITECADPYIKDTHCQKSKEKGRAAAEIFCSRNGEYRMPFAWTAIHLFDVVTGASMVTPVDQPDKDISPPKEGSGRRSPDLSSSGRASMRSTRSTNEALARRTSAGADVGRPGSGRYERPRSEIEESLLDLTNFRAISLTVSTFFKQESEKLSDEDLFKLLADLRRPNSLLRKLKCIHGLLKLDITPLPDNIKYCLTPELLQIAPYPDKQGAPVKEIQEFAPKEVFAPYVTYKNTLYVYPESLNFTNRTGSARNIAVKVQFMVDEDPSHALACIYGKSNGPEFVTEIMTPVVYHNKVPSFYEEVKIKLPLNLTESHHLLFTFYHISFKGESSGNIESSPVGYTWIPAIKDNRLNLGIFNLPVAIDKLPQSYSMLSTEIQLPNMKWVDGHKQVFSCSVQTVSSVHMQDKYLHKFFRFCHSVEGRISNGHMEANANVCKKIIEDLEKVKHEPLVRFLHLVLDKLFMLLVQPSSVSGTIVNISQYSFETLTKIVNKVHQLTDANSDKHARSDLLASYVSYVFSAPGSGTPVASPNESPLLAKVNNSADQPTLLQQSNLSNSNPSLNQQGKGHGHSFSLSSTPWFDDYMPECNNVAGNRNSVAESSSSRILHSANSYTSHSHRKLVHEEIALQWATASKTQYNDLAMQHAWFYFDIMGKSMAQYLDIADKLFWSRKERFYGSYMDDIEKLGKAVSTEILNKADDKSFKQARLLNISFAYFLNDLLSLMDRGYVLNLVKNHMKEMPCTERNWMFLKMELLHVLCSHEHYVVLNLPFSSAAPAETRSISPTPSLTSNASSSSMISISVTGRDSIVVHELSPEFRSQHYLIGMLLCEVKNSFDSCDCDTIIRGVNVLKDVILSHDVDSRYDSIECRNRIASLYLPLLAIGMEVLHTLYGYESDKDGVIDENVATAIATSTVNQRVVNADSRADLQNQDELEKRKSVSEIRKKRYSFGQLFDLEKRKEDMEQVEPVYEEVDKEVISEVLQMSTKTSKLPLEPTRHFLMCFMWVLKNLGKEQLKHWVMKLSASRLNNMLEVLDLGIKLFEYQPRNMNVGGKGGRSKTNSKESQAVDKKERLKHLENAIMNPLASREMLRRRKDMDLRPDRPQNSPKLRWKKMTHFKRTNDQSGTADENLDSQVEGSLCAEFSMITLDTLELLVQCLQNNDSMKLVADNCLKVLLQCLSCNQSVVVLQNMFATQRSILRKLPELVFEEETELCGHLCYHLLTHCSSSSKLIRAQASASLYLLMRQNFQIGNNFSRVKMQVTMSLSSLVGAECFNEDYLRKALKTIITYAQSDEELKMTPYPEQVRELVFNLHTILTDTVKMKEYVEDKEMYIDLQYRIAKGYQNSPDLRLTWLENMSKDHTKYNNFTEAGMCLVHSAALVAEYLKMLDDKAYLPKGCIDFERITYNAIEESAVSDDVLSPDEEGICTNKYFSVQGMVGLLENASKLFDHAQMYELMNEVEKILIPILEARREFKKLHSLHTRVAEAFNKILSTEGKRMMGTYFRVAFYGSIFGDMDSEEFIYKEPRITKLPEISNRLQLFYTEKFGNDKIEMIKDSNVVDVSKLDAEKGYIQITFVEPYFLEYEQDERVTYFERNNDLRLFMFVTPFTPSGKAHGDLGNQYKRKTILTVANAFPYIKTRINVIHREEIVLTPIEVAIEDVQSKTEELRKAIQPSKPDVKILQMVLQGCIGTTVNQGPFEIANVFLSELEKDRNGVATITRHHHKLRLCFKAFEKRCNEALAKNKTLISQDQIAYQTELQKNYLSFVNKLEPLLEKRFGQIRGSLRKKDGTLGRSQTFSPDQHGGS